MKLCSKTKNPRGQPNARGGVCSFVRRCCCCALAASRPTTTTTCAPFRNGIAASPAAAAAAARCWRWVAVWVCARPLFGSAASVGRAAVCAPCVCVPRCCMQLLAPPFWTPLASLTAPMLSLLYVRARVCVSVAHCGLDVAPGRVGVFFGGGVLPRPGAISVVPWLVGVVLRAHAGVVPCARTRTSRVLQALGLQ